MRNQTKKELEKLMEVFVKDGVMQVMFKNEPNNTTQTFNAQDVMDILTKEMKGE